MGFLNKLLLLNKIKKKKWVKEISLTLLILTCLAPYFQNVILMYQMNLTNLFIGNKIYQKHFNNRGKFYNAKGRLVILKLYKNLFPIVD